MPYSIELRFDNALDGQIGRIWRALAAMHACSMPGGEAAPHVSLAVYDDQPFADPARVAAILDALAEDRGPLPVTFSSIGVFPGEERVLYLAPVVTAPLLDLHAAWHTLAAELAAGCWPYYLPGSWVPHCTLATEVPTPGLASAIAHLHEHWTPLAGSLQSVALIRAHPVEVLHRRPFPG